MIRRVARVGGAGIASAISVLAAFLVISVSGELVRNEYFSLPRYEPLNSFDLRRDGIRVEGKIAIKKIRECDPTGAPPSFVRWLWTDQGGGTGISTSEIFIDGAPLKPRKVLEPGQTVILGPVSTTIPKDARASGRIMMEVIAICDPGDGRLRPYFVTPQIVVPPDDGPATVAMNPVRVSLPN